MGSSFPVIIVCRTLFRGKCPKLTKAHLVKPALKARRLHLLGKPVFEQHFSQFSPIATPLLAESRGYPKTVYPQRVGLYLFWSPQR